jgi:hypothetical protein
LEYYKNKVDDKSVKAGGQQCITTLEGHVIPLDIINGLPCMKIKPPSDADLRDLPHVIMTSGAKWDPTKFNLSLSDKEDWYNTICELEEGKIKSAFDEYGRYLGREPTTAPALQINLNNEEEDDDESVPDLDDDASSSDNDSEPRLVRLRNFSDDEDSDDKDGYTNGALHEFRVAFHIVSDLNSDFEAFPTVTRRIKKILLQKEAKEKGRSKDDDTPRGEEEEEEKTPIDTEAAVKDEDTDLQFTDTSQVKDSRKDYTKYRPYFLHVPVDKLQKTFENTSQFATNVVSGIHL